ncbi:MAG: HD domain-containing protein [candidate division WS1 bacterium]|jgi:3'-5' exoribonuclease|nr:HD domain-containing protein [candidate division WS1 bacterium]
MASKRIAELEIGERIIGTYAARDRSLASFKSKPGQYLSLTLGDATGELSARMWDGAEEAAACFQPGDAVTVRAVVEEYRGQKQLVVEKLKKADLQEIEGVELIATGAGDSETLCERVLEAVESVQNPHLRALLETFFGDPEFLDRFSRAPGAKSLHHSYLGGLLEHTVGVLELLETVARVHPQLDRDLMIAGALLHDLGKVAELECNASIEYTDCGRLVGHTVLTDRMVNRAIDAIEGFPEELSNRITHLLLSHHGQREYGAPVLPMIAEACALHYADNLDAHVQYFGQVIADGRAAGSQWSDYQRLFERYIYVGARCNAPGGQLAPSEAMQQQPQEEQQGDQSERGSIGGLFDH